MQIAADLGFEITKEEKKIYFTNRRAMVFRNLSYFTGVLTACLSLAAIAFVWIKPPDWFALSLGAGIPGLFLSLAFTFCLKQYLRRRRYDTPPPPPRYIADLQQGLLLTGKGRKLASLADVRVLVKMAGDTYTSDEIGPSFEKVVLRWGWRREIVVFKTEDELEAKKVQKRLAKDGCGRI